MKCDVDYIRDETSLIWLIPKARHLLKKRMRDKFREYDISWEQWATLSRIYRTEGCNQKKLADMSIRDNAAITRVLNILESKKLVRRENSPHDKREFLIYLTDEGYALYKETELVIYQCIQEINAIFSEEELQQLIYLLYKLIFNLE